MVGNTCSTVVSEMPSHLKVVGAYYWCPPINPAVQVRKLTENFENIHLLCEAHFCRCMMGTVKYNPNISLLSNSASKQVNIN